MKKVAITGTGLIVSGHVDANILFDTLASGKSIIRQDERMRSLGLPRVPSGALFDDQVDWLDRTYPQIRGNKTSVAGKMLYHSAEHALHNARLGNENFSRKHGMFIGINKNLITIEQLLSMLTRYNSASSTLVPRSVSQLKDFNLLRPDQTLEPLTQKLNFEGIVQIHSDACSAGAAAVVSAYRRIVTGQIDLAICGATEQGCQPVMHLLFSHLGALCKKTYEKEEFASRAFDKDRSGCVLSDGAAVLILEDEARARARGVDILAYITGASRQSEAFQIAASSPDGDHYAQCMKMAIQDAGISPEDINHINAHGTSTTSNDEAESRAIYSLFNAGPSVTSTKSALGHSLAASGTIELALSALSIQRQAVLPSINYFEPRPSEPRINIVKKSGPQRMDYILSNSFGFGGENVSIVIARAES